LRGDRNDDPGGTGCEFEDLNLVTDETLTVATDEPVFPPPWMGVGDENFDVPESKTGFEGALVYELASRLGFTDDQVTFVRTGFDEAIAVGPKDWDFNIQQYSITEAREEVVDFSDPYYTTSQALVTFADSPFASATTIDDLKDAKLGAAIGTTSLDFAENVIEPNEEVSVYDENVDVEAAMNAGQIDGLIVDLPTAYFVTAVQVERSVIAGQFRGRGGRARRLRHALRDRQPPCRVCQRCARRDARRRHFAGPRGRVAHPGRCSSDHHRLIALAAMR
jgi:polar amino acid transport system substrate-binding protein